jgi:hypothetical protein
LLEPAIMQHCTLTPMFPSQEDGNKRKHTHSITLRRATNTEPSQVGRWLSIYPTRCSRGLLALQCIQWVEQWNLFLWGRPGSGLGVLKLARSPSPALGPPLYYVCPTRWSDQTTRQGVVPEPTARVGPLPAPPEAESLYYRVRSTRVLNSGTIALAPARNGSWAIWRCWLPVSPNLHLYKSYSPNLGQAKMAVKFVLIKSCVLVSLLENQPWLPVMHKENTDHRSYYFSSDQSTHATATCLSSRSLSD